MGTSVSAFIQICHAFIPRFGEYWELNSPILIFRVADVEVGTQYSKVKQFVI